jgi:hypothetical protein
MLRRLSSLCLFLAACASPGNLALSTNLVDFGPALPGVERVENLDLVNPGGSTLAVTDVRQTSGTAVFSLVLPSRLTLSPSQTRSVEVHYLPVDTGQADEATFELITDVPGVTATVTLRGQPTSPDCTLPDALDFGQVARGDTLRIETPFANTSAFAATAFAGPVESQEGPGTFTFASDSPAGSFTVPGTSTTVVAVLFTPAEARDYLATILMRRHQLCGAKPVRLIGMGVAAVLTWTPAMADFGSVAAGTVGRATITFSNQMFWPLEVTQLWVDAPFLLPVDHLTVPAATRGGDGNIVVSTAQLEVTFSPVSTGPQVSQLRGVTNLSTQPAISANLRGVGAP